MARRYDAKLLLVVQDLMAKAAGQSGITGGGRVSRATARLERHALRRADRVAIVSEAFRAPVRDYGVTEDRIRLLPNWTRIAPSPLDRHAARAALGWPVKPFTVVHTGNIGFKQDLGNVVEAARLSQNDPGMRFVVVGNGSQREAIRQQGIGLANLDFVDTLDDEQYPQTLAAADVLVVNERPGVGDMSLPSKLTSYLAAGRPVVAAVDGEGATARELQRTNAALQVPAGNPALLAEAMRSLYQRPEARQRMGEAARLYANTTLGRAAAMTRLDSLIEECLYP